MFIVFPPYQNLLKSHCHSNAAAIRPKSASRIHMEGEHPTGTYTKCGCPPSLLDKLECCDCKCESHGALLYLKGKGLGPWRFRPFYANQSSEVNFPFFYPEFSRKRDLYEPLLITMAQVLPFLISADCCRLFADLHLLPRNC